MTCLRDVWRKHTMSLLPTTTVKAQLSAALGEREQQYWETFRLFLCGQLSRVEFEDEVRESLNTPQLGECVFIP
jgi:hypothetical protein